MGEWGWGCTHPSQKPHLQSWKHCPSGAVTWAGGKIARAQQALSAQRVLGLTRQRQSLGSGQWCQHSPCHGPCLMIMPWDPLLPLGSSRGSGRGAQGPSCPPLHGEWPETNRSTSLESGLAESTKAEDVPVTRQRHRCLCPPRMGQQHCTICAGSQEPPRHPPWPEHE